MKNVAPRRLLQRGSQKQRRGFTLLEVMVVSGISLMLAGVGAFIYANSLRIYRESQGLTDVYECAKLINRDLNDYLGCVIPVRGAWVKPRTLQMPGQPNAWNPHPELLHNFWTNFSGSKQGYFQNNLAYDPMFSGPSDVRSYNNIGIRRFELVSTIGRAINYGGSRGWWVPAFFGKRDGMRAYVVQHYEVLVRAWGWPQPDYRLDADADKLLAGSATVNNGANVACWFYAEDRYVNSCFTMALDNSSVLLTSIKFSQWTENNRERTQLSFLKHHVGGFDHSYMGSEGMVRGDAAYGNLMRAISIIPYYMDANGILQTMGDAELGCRLDGSTIPASGTEVPRCFDIRYRLRNPVTLQSYTFGLRVYCRINPQ